MSDVSSAFDRDEALKFGWNQVKANSGFFIAWLAIDIVAMVVFGAARSVTESSMPVLSAAINVISQGLQIIIGMGVTVGLLKMYDGKRPDVADLFSNLPLFWKYLGTSLLFGLAAVAGFALLIIPGYYIMLRYGFAGYASLDEGLGPMAAMRRSGEITEGVVGELLVFSLLMFGVVLLGALALGVGLLVALPTVMAAHVFVYRKLVERARLIGGMQPPATDPAG